MRANFQNAPPTRHALSETAISTQVDIGITTRDRWDDLALTLSELRTQGYEDVETIVIDDGSKKPLPQALRTAFPKVRFERVDTSLGLVVQRNRLARMLSSTITLAWMTTRTLRRAILTKPSFGLRITRLSPL
jgi:GT2 family glycosyltransferase